MAVIKGGGACVLGGFFGSSLVFWSLGLFCMLHAFLAHILLC